jgi:acetoin utilization deacetylase AcuC-like enzyme
MREAEMTMARPIAIVSHPACFAHETGEGHPDSRARLPAIREAIRADPRLGDACLEVEAQPAEEVDLLRVHAADHLALVRDTATRAGARGGIDWLDPDTAVSGESWLAVSGAAGCAITAAELVATGHARAAFALSRPPGHHARFDAAAGFCLVNNVAVAARRLQAMGLARRILIVDWDAHHGDGTQAIFWDDPSVYLLSVHLDDEFPGTGAADERGGGAGRGATRNLPLSRTTTAAAYRERFTESLDATLAEFAPDFVLVSAGFDCLAGDPEGGLGLEPADLHAITRLILERTQPSAAGRVVAVLEGGYVPERIGQGAVNVLRALADLPPHAGRDVPGAGAAAP